MSETVVNYVIKGFPLIRFNTREVIDITRKGNIRLTSLKKYRDMYKESADEVIGDPYEGQLYIHSGQVTIFPSGEKRCISDGAIPTINQDDFVLCMFGINPNKQSFIKFTEKQIKQLADRYDTAMVITDVQEFGKRLFEAASNKGLVVRAGFVSYYNDKVDEGSKLVDLLSNGIENIVFYKRNMYSYQQEFRFTISNQTGDDFLDLPIGDITDITEAISTKDIINSEIIQINK